MKKNYDAIVIGVGSMGAATCYQLAQRGVRVLGIEQFSIPHDLGSASGLTRAIRLAYCEHSNYVTLLKRGFELWGQLEQETRENVLTVTGGLYLGREDCELVTGSLQAALEHGLPHEMLTHAEIARRFPQFRLPDEFVGFYEPGAGFLKPDRAIASYAEAAKRAGANLHVDEKVIRWGSTRSGVEVETDQDTYSADKLILTAGPWSGRLLSELGVDLRVTRQTALWVLPEKPEGFGLGKFPVWALESSAKEPQGPRYGFPMAPGLPGLKMAWHHQGRPTDPDNVDRTESAQDIDELLPFLQQVLPESHGEVVSLSTCLYTNSPDGHFIVDRHPTHENVFLACGFSGHGFKFAGVIGETLADLATDGHTKNPVTFLGLRRFSRV
jgi:sarcosine oxidase